MLLAAPGVEPWKTRKPLTEHDDCLNCAAMRERLRAKEAGRGRLKFLEVLMSHFVHYDEATCQYRVESNAKPIDGRDVHLIDTNRARSCRECLELFEGEGLVCPECLEHESNKKAHQDLQERESSDGLHPGHDF